MVPEPTPAEPLGVSGDCASSVRASLVTRPAGDYAGLRTGVP